MKAYVICYRILICLSMLLSIGHPMIQLSAKQIAPYRQEVESPIVVGKLSNGMNYALLPSEKLKGGVWIKLTFSTPDLQEKMELMTLTHCAAFYGTEQMNRNEIAGKLNALGLDVSPDQYLLQEEQQQSLHILLPAHAAGVRQLQEVLELLNQLSLHATLNQEAIEMAQQHLLLKNEAIKPISAANVKAFHESVCLPSNLLVTVAGHIDVEAMQPILAKAFDAQIVAAKTITSERSAEDSLLSPFRQSVEWTTDHQALVVDGKIWMKEPNWINKSTNGRTLGAILSALGIGGMIVAFSYFTPAALITGGLSAVTGFYFLTAGYLKDPNYVESARKTDLQYGCAYAYKNGRAGITLTPYERRAAFLQEMVDQPHKLPKLPILLLADLYQLNDPVIAEIFTVDEFNALSRLKRDFIQQRNQYKMLMENLERELATLVAPYAFTRDAGLSKAQDSYNQNYYVVLKKTLKLQRDASIADIDKAYKDLEITLDEKDTLINQANAYYDNSLKQPDLQAGLNAADTMLAHAELEVQATYNYQVEVAKQTIQYHQRMEYFKQGEQSHINYFNQELRNLLASFPVYFTIFPDYLDLRGL